MRRGCSGRQCSDDRALTNDSVETKIRGVDVVLQALGSPRRREILRLVWEGERTAGAIRDAFDDVTFGAVSQHLARLREAGLVEVRTAGRQRFYRARPDAVGSLRPWLEELWDSALYRLKLAAELEEQRRGPRPRRSGSRRRARRTR